MIKWLILLLFSFPLFASVTIDQMVFECHGKHYCEHYKSNLAWIVGTHSSLSQIHKQLKIFASDDSIQNMNYQIYSSNKKLIFQIELSERNLISKIVFTSSHELDFAPLEKTLALSEGMFFNRKLFAQNTLIIRDHLRKQGHNFAEISQKVEQSTSGLILRYHIDISHSYYLSNVELSSQYSFQLNRYNKYFKQFLKQPWNQILFSFHLEELKKRLIKEGHLFASISSTTSFSKRKVTAKISVKEGKRYQVYLFNQSKVDSKQLKQVVKDMIQNLGTPLRKEKLSNELAKHIATLGYEKPQILLSLRSGQTKTGLQVENVIVTILPSLRKPVGTVHFYGNRNLSKQAIQELYFKHASTLAKRGFLDQIYLDQFRDHLKTLYLKNGFVFAKIIGPQIIFNHENRRYNIEYSIREGQPTTLDQLILSGIPDQERLILLTQLKNKPLNPLDVTAIAHDIETIESHLQAQGFLFAKVINKTSKSLLRYSSNYKQANLLFQVNQGKKAELKSVIITGNIKTRNRTIEQELSFNQGALITPQMLSKAKNQLLGLGIFSEVTITPNIIHTTSDRFYVNLHIFVKERDSIILDLAPGYRNDMGLKVSTGLTFLNLRGKNRTFSIHSQVNQKLNVNDLDSRRTEDNKNLLEYTIKTHYAHPHILGSNITADFILETSRQRYYSFDGDTSSFTSTFSKLLSDHITFSTSFQFERIRQYNASNEKDNGIFQIGSVIPSLSLDYRNSPSNPTTGWWSALSFEYAAPELYSTDQYNQAIHFFSTTLSNKFYFRINSESVFASFLSLGYQQNLQKAVYYKEDGTIESQGSIPSIKVFRLGGQDLVRGYSDEEINRMSNGDDVTDFVITNKTYYLNLKLEPRYYIDENIILGFFYDAGRVYIKTPKPFHLRSSIGLSWKYLTPVGSLAFDYGFKLNRKDYGGKRENIGRLHLSIGTF